MGRGDVKTAKGKRFRSSFGKSRPRKAGTNLNIPIQQIKEPKITTTATSKKSSTKKSEAKSDTKKKVTTKKVDKPKAETTTKKKEK